MIAPSCAVTVSLFPACYAVDFSVLIEKKLRRFGELEAEIGGGSLFADAAHAREVLREHARLKELMALWNHYAKTGRELKESRALAAGEDSEMAELALADLPELERRLPELEKDENQPPAAPASRLLYLTSGCSPMPIRRRNEAFEGTG